MWKSSLTERARVAGVVCSRVAATHTDSSGCFIHDRMLTLNNSYYHHGWRLHSLAASHNVIHQVIHEGAVTVVDDDHIERRDVLAPQLANLIVRNHVLYKFHRRPQARAPASATHPFVQEPHRDDGVSVDAWRRIATVSRQRTTARPPNAIHTHHPPSTHRPSHRRAR